ncbi:DEAD/DEAH box helicase family protein [Canibacter sp. lx-45]|uniref:DEAD/DEAH box helicase n=1 Tax=Canibacter zhuwentaonis TaxID=2837491 RepID=UPI001BDD9773|nr:DEAD/DEAH box helicase family protein [Canibacter zhuwentaonis]MBT1035491.1 DEAD/DEAH box helicase family protein [Canibacter zhuwentaonis]
MTTRLNISFDSDMLEAISSEFELRAPNKAALRQLIFTLDGGYEPSVMQVLNLATGVGKTYLMVAFVEYLRRQGVGNVVIVTPGKTVQAKTVQNFTPGSPRYISGSVVPPEVVTPQDYSAWVTRQNGLAPLVYGREVPLLAFIFNIQQLIAPKDAEGETRGNTQEAMRRKPRRFDESAGVLFDYLKELDDLVVIADESHLYSSSAVAFNAALKELDPAAVVGLTASADKKVDRVIYEYPLYRAIQDKYVKAPVLAFRKAGYGIDETSEEQQLRDALQLRAIKQRHYDAYATSKNCARVNAVVFVVCADVEHATQVANLLRTPEYFGTDEAVLQVDSKHEDELTQHRLDTLDAPESAVLAVVSVNKLKEGWDVKNIAVVVTLRAMASEVLTQQTMGRGLRLPFGKYTGVWQIDQLDIIAHQSFTELLRAENVLQQFGLEEAVSEQNKVVVADAIRAAAAPTGDGVGSAPSCGALPAAAPTGDGVGSAPSCGALPAAAPTGDGVGSAPSCGALHANSTGGVLLGTASGAALPAGASGAAELYATADAAAVGAQSGAVFVGGDTAPGVGICELNDRELSAAAESAADPVFIERNPVFADVTYYFPVTTVTMRPPVVQLAKIDDAQVEQAARRVTSTGEMLHRKEIVAVLGKKLRAEDRESAEVDSVYVSDDKAQNALVQLVMNLPLVPKTEQIARYVKTFLVPKFMQSVTFAGWSVKSLDSARAELADLVRAHVKNAERQIPEIPVIRPVAMPGDGYTLPLGARVHAQIESRAQFVRGRVYGGWAKSLFEAESFDSYSGEYKLAQLLNTDPRIKWWHRLHPQDKAAVYYNAKDRYFPDFVAQDTEGVYWIIEGKSERGRDDAQVNAKRKVAEALVRQLITEDAYEGQHWGYLIAYEKDVAKAESWEDLKTFAHPVSSAL